jgi:putative transposase
MAANGKAKQMRLHLPTWGGPRKRKRAQVGRRKLGKVPHRRRPALCGKHPVLVTWRVLPHVWNLRSERCFSRLRECFERGRDRFGFRLVHFSVQGNHLHLIVEALDERSLARGMQGLGVRIAKALNRLMRRKGTVFADHYHARQLTSPTQVANAVTYVLLNFAHHFPEEARRAAHVRDRFSSAWRDRGRDPPVVPARTWLLRVGWRLQADERVVMLVDAAAPDFSVAADPRAA